MVLFFLSKSSRSAGPRFGFSQPLQSPLCSDLFGGKKSSVHFFAPHFPQNATLAAALLCKRRHNAFAVLPSFYGDAGQLLVFCRSAKKLCDGLDISLGEFFSAPEFDELEQELK